MRLLTEAFGDDNTHRTWPGTSAVEWAGTRFSTLDKQLSLSLDIFSFFFFSLFSCLIILSSSHLSLNREGRWGTTDDFATSFLHFPLFSTALWDFANSRPVHSPMSSSNLFLCLPVFFPLSLCLARWFWPDLMNGKYDHTTAVCVSLRWSGGFRVVRLPAGSWHRLPRW